MTNVNDFVLKTDVKLFQKYVPSATLTNYYKTKSNSIRIAFFDNKQFIAIETPKANNIFQNLVLNMDTNNIYNLLKKDTIVIKNNKIKYNIYIGNINI